MSFSWLAGRGGVCFYTGNLRLSSWVNQGRVVGWEISYLVVIDKLISPSFDFSIFFCLIYAKLLLHPSRSVAKFPYISQLPQQFPALMYTEASEGEILSFLFCALLTNWITFKKKVSRFYASGGNMGEEVETQLRSPHPIPSTVRDRDAEQISSHPPRKTETKKKRNIEKTYKSARLYKYWPIHPSDSKNGIEIF
jgi:hypothetical protein